MLLPSNEFLFVARVLVTTRIMRKPVRQCASPKMLRAANLLAGFADMHQDIESGPVPTSSVAKLSCGMSAQMGSTPSTMMHKNMNLVDDTGRDNPVRNAHTLAAAAAVQEAIVTVQREQGNLAWQSTECRKRACRASMEPAHNHKYMCAAQSTPSSITAVTAAQQPTLRQMLSSPVLQLQPMLQTVRQMPEQAQRLLQPPQLSFQLQQVSMKCMSIASPDFIS